MPARFASTLLHLSKRKRVLLLLLCYTAQLVASLWLAYELRFDFAPDAAATHERLFVLCWLVPLQLILLGLFHQLDTLPGYFSTPDLAQLFHSLLTGGAITGLVWLFWGAGYAPPRGVIALDFVLALVGLTGVRLALRTLSESARSPLHHNGEPHKSVGIIGAGDAGAVLAHELLLKPGYGLQPVAFFDDDRRKWNSRVHDIPVLGPPEQLLEENGDPEIHEVIIAMPSAPAKRVGELARLLHKAHLPCKTVPSLDQLALGQVRVTQLRNVEIQDLLGRDDIKLDSGNIAHVLEGRVVLVTGAGGSIGSELCRQIAAYHPQKLLLLDRSEPHVFEIEQDLIRSGHGSRIVPLVADIQDAPRMRKVLEDFRPEVVFHAAAHKHVPMMESQPAEAVQNNSLGSARLADLSVELGVERFILVSSDKAINPTSVMGATKRLAEIYLQALWAAHPGKTRFMAVRFGNVLGSSGSVIPLFQRQIAEGGPVKVTHPDMTRFFMTIPEACMLVLQSAALGEGGEIFVLDMGKPVRILDLARQMIELSGLKPEQDIKIEFVGTRPGEKLFEEVSHKGENFAPTPHPKICRFLCHPAALPQVQEHLSSLELNLHHLTASEVKLALRNLIPEYTPYLPATSPSSPTPPAQPATAAPSSLTTPTVPSVLRPVTSEY
jgi:FlaA1/EpsC-like NDP-sugar epimerase